ncbi:MAG: hypothetical protein HOA57_01430 [Candidatus Magasanikbacteria bacterium]|jgi:hypothetical protein|nr:hypothetical protein [Candidatus Magasanikbacteria bacterium]MBT4315214.1 hypothetical protein [Candidatus Magasanikbacteria bacterium]MBT4547254.1 hypothetical protein [Candidatus Magasanikbacteria bacterium]MBT6819021.1 hypothetical protein [Candidatus Magasanikbacteria bacterium]
MSVFKKKKLNPPKRVCLRLKEARESCGFSLERLSKKTKISKDFLQALEECRFQDLPKAEIYQKNFVKSYLEALSIDPGPYLQQYLSEESDKKKKMVHPNKEVKRNYLHDLPAFLRYGFVIIFLLSLFFYLGMQVKNIVEPPRLEVYSPPQGFITNEMSMVLNGETDKEVSVSLNGKDIGTDEEGNFEEVIDLSPGVNTLTIEARKKHGKTTREVRHVTLKIEDN